MIKMTSKRGLGTMDGVYIRSSCHNTDYGMRQEFIFFTSSSSFEYSLWLIQWMLNCLTGGSSLSVVNSCWVKWQLIRNNFLCTCIFGVGDIYIRSSHVSDYFLPQHFWYILNIILPFAPRIIWYDPDWVYFMNHNREAKTRKMIIISGGSKGEENQIRKGRRGQD